MDSDLMKEYRELSAKKDEIESAIKALAELLEQQGVGMQDSLVDNGDFPRSDIDVYSVRQARHNIRCLQTDHTAIMKQLEEKLYAIHAQAREKNAVKSSGAAGGSHDSNAAGAAGSDNPGSSSAFVTVDSVAQGSPAQVAGLQSGDLITEFGSITKSNYRNISDIGQAVIHSKNRPLRITVVRAGHIQHLALTPQEWTGKGLLGCHIVNIDRSSR